MSKATGGGANDVTRFLYSGVGPGSPTSNSSFSAASQADWAAKRLVWVPSEKHGFEVSQREPLTSELLPVSDKRSHPFELPLKGFNKSFLQPVVTFLFTLSKCKL